MLTALADCETLHSDLAGDLDLTEILEQFVQEMPDRLRELVACFRRGDFEGLGRAAHRIKGAAGSYGFHAVTPTAAALETAVRRDGEAASIKAALEDLIHLCLRIRAGLPS